MAEAHRGTCFCGAVEIEVTGAPLSAFLLWRAEDVKVVRGAEHLGRFNKTGMSDQQHSTKCGGHVMTAHPGLGLTDVRPPVLPGVTFELTVHLNYAVKVLPVREGLTKLKDFPAHPDGFGEAVPE